MSSARTALTSSRRSRGHQYVGRICAPSVGNASFAMSTNRAWGLVSGKETTFGSYTARSRAARRASDGGCRGPSRIIGRHPKAIGRDLSYHQAVTGGHEAVARRSVQAHSFIRHRLSSTRAVIGSCLRCVYWQRIAEHTDAVVFGECRRYPPDVIDDPVDGHAGVYPAWRVWPTTTSYDWCGEFTPLRKQKS